MTESIILQLDRTEHQNIFKPGVRVRAQTTQKLVSGFLFEWIPGATHFLIINPKTGSVTSLEYFRCKWIEVWPQTSNHVKLLKKMMSDLKSGKLSVKMTPEHIQKLQKLLST